VRNDNDRIRNRVSTDGQTLDAQQAALRDAGCEKVYAEKISGVVTDRKALVRAIDALGTGDTLVVCKLDRLARSTRDLLNVLAEIAFSIKTTRLGSFVRANTRNVLTNC
jgi:DNA invertase Pin-like site-specific DNA recombinase